MKTFFSSKTIWFGIFQTLFGLTGLAFGFIDKDMAMSLIVTGVGSVALRLKTSQPIE